MKQPPVQWRGPVRITNSKYAIWSCIPVQLGEINKVGNYWITPDGVRFVSSRDAADYMLKMYANNDKTQSVSDVIKSANKAIKEAMTPVKKTSEDQTNPVKKTQEVRQPERRVIGKELAKISATLLPEATKKASGELPKEDPVDAVTPGKPNNAVNSKSVRIQKLKDSVRELLNEIQGD